MNTLRTVLFVFVVLAINLVIGQEKVKELKSYKTDTGLKIKPGMYFTILEGDHYKIDPPNFWDIPGAGKISDPRKLFSYFHKGNTYLIKKILKIKGTKTVLVGFQNIHKMFYVYLNRALEAKEIEIKESLNIDLIVKI